MVIVQHVICLLNLGSILYKRIIFAGVYCREGDWWSNSLAEIFAGGIFCKLELVAKTTKSSASRNISFVQYLSYLLL